MLKVAAAGVAALFVAASPAYAQNNSAEPQSNSAETQGHMSAAEPDSLTNLRIETVKDALQLTPSQQQYWPAIEDAIRARAKHRVARLEDFAQRASDLRGSDPYDLALNRNPVDFLHRRADALAQRSSDLKKLADAWQPLYENLSSDQKQRLALLRVSVLREVMSRVRGSDDEFYDEDEQQ